MMEHQRVLTAEKPLDVGMVRGEMLVDADECEVQKVKILLHRRVNTKKLLIFPVQPFGSKALLPLCSLNMRLSGRPYI